MRAIIMAGGEGTRLKSVTGELPKPMVLLAGKPVLEHILALLRRCGIDTVCMSLHYRPEVITEYFGDGSRFGMSIRYHIEENPLGTAGGIKACSDFYGDRDFLVISGDSACDFDLRALMEAHHRHHPAVTMALYASPSPLQYGTVLTDARGRVVSFTEKPEWSRVVSDLINTGIYIVSPQAMELVPEDTVYDFSRDLFPRLLAGGMEIRALPMDGYWCDIGTPRAYYQCCLDALDGKYTISDPPQETVLPQSPTAAQRNSKVRHISVNDRAGVMRAVTSAMMELGADFADGIVFDDGNGYVRIHPDGTESAILVESDKDDVADTFERFVKRQVT